MITTLTIAALLFLPGSAPASADVLLPAVTLPQDKLEEPSVETSPALPILPWRSSPQEFASWPGPWSMVASEYDPSRYDYGYVTW
jgi:hypothetical protein